MHVARAGALIMTVALVAACSGNDDAAPTTTVAPPVTIASTAPATTAATTTVAPTTPTTAATVAPSTTPAPTIPPATAPADIEQVKQDVIATAIASNEAYLDAARNPTDEAKLARLPEVLAGAKLERVVQIVADIATSGRVAVANPDVPATVTMYEDTFVYDPTAGTASIEFCRIGSDLGVIPGGNPDGTDQIVVDGVSAYHERSDFVLLNGRWYDAGGAVIQTFEGETTCVRA